jgi:hypothetical protein
MLYEILILSLNWVGQHYHIGVHLLGHLGTAVVIGTALKKHGV